MSPPDIAAIVAKATEIVAQQTIDIPKIIVVPSEPVEIGFHPFTLDLTAETIYLLEPKMKTQMTDDDVLAKKAAAVQWCQYASGHAQKYGGKPWVYVLIPHDAIAQNMTLKGLAKQCAC